jgi:FkbM family methyltransferase
LGKLVCVLVKFDLGLKWYNQIYERTPYFITKMFVKNIHLPKRDFLWSILLVNKKTIKTKVYGNNVKTAQFALSYKWHSPSLNFAESFLMQNSDRNDPCIDVGANLGIRSLLALSEGRQVYMVEPNEELNKLNEERCILNGFKHYQILPIGSSNEKGTAEFYIDESSYNSSLDVNILNNNVLDKSVKISLDTLDNMLSGISQRPAYIKIDVEGHEIQVLKGAEGIIKKWYPPFIVEVNGNSNNFTKFNSLMSEHGYSIYQIKDYGNKKFFKEIKDEEIDSNDFLAVKDLSLEKLVNQYTKR